MWVYDRGCKAGRHPVERSFMKPRARISAGFSALGLFVLLPSFPVLSQTSVQARILRLSFVEGRVTIQRPDVQGWAEAPVNTPLQQGFKLSTGENSFAEIQFENGGTLRLGEQSLIELTELGLGSDGSKTSRASLLQGYATFHPLSSRGQESLQVETPLGGLSAEGGAEFRVDLDQGMERVEVFDGSVEEESSLGSITLQKEDVLVLQPGAPEPTTVSQGITLDDWDQWVADREAHLEMADAAPSPGGYVDPLDGTPYGWGDLAQNGSWIDVDGEGSGWSPRAIPGWSPYSSGQWCWYPGMGFTWIGSEPWGWLPYHYGAWEFVPGRGWVWFPGSLKTWSPAQVRWYQGPDWIGWRPRSHRKDPRSDCGTTCGGGVVSTALLRAGGYVTPQNTLGVNIASGTMVSAPRVNPSTTPMLPGIPAAFPAAQVNGSQWTVSRPEAGGTWASASPSSHTPLGPRRGAGSVNSAIVYDPQQGSYINGHHSTPPLVQPAFPPEKAQPATGNSWAVSPAQTPDSTQPFPNEGQQQVGAPLGGLGYAQPAQGVYAAPPPAAAAPGINGGARSGAGTGQTGTGHAGSAGTNRGAAWTPAGGAGHSSPPPAPSAPGGRH
jgi:hypothetical protein